MARRYVNPNRTDDAAMVDVGTMKRAIRAELSELRRTGRLADLLDPVPRDAPPGAKLDSEPFARNWARYLKAVRTDGPERRVIANAWTERRGADGGFLVPWSLTEKVFAYLSEAVIWPRASVLTMGEYRVGLPTLDNPSQASGAQGLGGITFSLTPDGGAITASNPEFGAQFLEAQKLAALISPVPNELAADAEAAFDDLFSRITGMGLAWQLDDLFYNGSGVAEPQGILYSPAALAVTRATSSEVLHADVVAMAKALHPASKKKATWLASEDTFDFLLDLYETVGTAPSGQQIPPPGSLKFNSQSGQWELLGLAFEVSDHQPPIGTPGDLVLCDLSLYQIGSREMMTVDVSSKGATFAADASAYRVRTRVDGRFLPQSTYTLANGKTVSPLVVLN
jgi:HK97 family phage major capsid protein